MTTGSQVPNPEYQQLQQALQAFREQAATLESALDAPLGYMTSNQVWVGPAAREWTAQLDGQRVKLRQLVSSQLDEVQNLLLITPSTVTSGSG